MLEKKSLPGSPSLLMDEILFSWWFGMRGGGHQIDLDILKATPCWHEYKVFESWSIIPGKNWRHRNGRIRIVIWSPFVYSSGSQTCLLRRIPWGSMKISKAQVTPPEQLSHNRWVLDTGMLNVWSSPRDSRVPASLANTALHTHGMVCVCI